MFDGGKAKDIRNKNVLFETPQSLAEAKLTGCKNISRAKKLDNNFIFAEEWNLKLKCLEGIKDNINYIAIRSHNIKLYKNDEEENVFEVLIENIVENPFDYTLYINSINSNSRYLIHFTVSKEEMVFNINEKIKVKFEPQYLFAFKS